MTIYGEPSPELAATFASMADHVKFTQFSFFQGLDEDVKEVAS